MRSGCLSSFTTAVDGWTLSEEWFKIFPSNRKCQNIIYNFLLPFLLHINISISQIWIVGNIIIHCFRILNISDNSVGKLLTESLLSKSYSPLGTIILFMHLRARILHKHYNGVPMISSILELCKGKLGCA